MPSVNVPIGNCAAPPTIGMFEREKRYVASVSHHTAVQRNAGIETVSRVRTGSAVKRSTNCTAAARSRVHVGASVGKLVMARQQQRWSGSQGPRRSVPQVKFQECVPC